MHPPFVPLVFQGAHGRPQDQSFVPRFDAGTWKPLHPKRGGLREGCSFWHNLPRESGRYTQNDFGSRLGPFLKSNSPTDQPAVQSC